MTAITRGYGRFDLKPEMFLAASIEAVFGAFMWVALIAILARKTSGRNARLATGA
jgi:hypothetical protein